MRATRLPRVWTVGFSWLLLGLLAARMAASETAPLPDGLYAEFVTPRGNFTCELFYQQAPLTVANFSGLAEGKLGPEPRKPFFDGLKFHRVVPDFVVQGGDPDGTGDGGPGYQFADEFAPGLHHDAVGMLSMANDGPDTNGSQFFLTLRPVNRLNYLHSVFGRTVRGIDVLPRIKPDDVITAVHIQRIGAAAQAFRNDVEAFGALASAAKKYDGRLEPGPVSHFYDPDGLLPVEVPRALYFNYQLANFERATGLRIFIRVIGKYKQASPGQRPGTYTGNQARQLGFTDHGIVAMWFADRGKWGLWIGDHELPMLMGRDGTIREYMQGSGLHQAKQALIKAAEDRAVDMIREDEEQAVAKGKTLAENDRVKNRVNAMIETLFNRFEPRP